MQTSCSYGVVMALGDRRCTALGKTWSLFGVYAALRLLGPTRVQVATPGERGVIAMDGGYCVFVSLCYPPPSSPPAVGMAVEEVEGLLDTFQGIDICKSETSVPDHKADLLSRIRTTWGIQRTNRELVEGLSHSLLGRLRWGGRAKDNATLAVMLLKASQPIVCRYTWMSSLSAATYLSIAEEGAVSSPGLPVVYFL